jgi:hypothetical protein
MTERLPIPLSCGAGVFDQADLRAPKSGSLADSRDAADSGDYFRAVLLFLQGAVTAMRGPGGELEGEQLRSVLRHLPIRSAELLSIRAMLLHDPDDGIEGAYDCPRCGERIVCELTDDADTRDRISELKVAYADPEGREAEGFDLEVEPPVRVVDKKDGSAVYECRSLRLAWPTLAHAMASKGRYGASGATGRQFAIYVDAALEVNGEKVLPKWRGEYGMLTFRELQGQTIRALNEAVQRYGITPRLRKRCAACGKEWEAEVRTSNFFASGLRST